MSVNPIHNSNHVLTYAERIRHSISLQEQQKQHAQTLCKLREEAFAKKISCTLSQKEISRRTTLKKCEKETRSSLIILFNYYLRPYTNNLRLSEDCTPEEHVNRWLDRDLTRVMQKYQRENKLPKRY